MSDIVRKEVEKLMRAHQGKVTPEELVQVAKKPEHALHEYFEWDDSVAGHKYRLDQARDLLRSVRIVEDVGLISPMIAAPRFVHDPTDGGQSYRSLMSLRTDKGRARAVMIEELRRVEGALRRAQSVALVLGFDEELKKVEERVGHLRELVAA